MTPKIIEGKIIELEVKGKVFLALDMPRKPEGVKMSFSVDSVFRPYLNKKIKITIEKIEE